MTPTDHMNARALAAARAERARSANQVALALREARTHCDAITLALGDARGRHNRRAAKLAAVSPAAAVIRRYW